MPTIGVKRSLLFEELEQTYTDEEFDQLCFDFGIELDDIEPIPESNGKDVEYKIDIPANRYDILCLEGLSRALKIFLQKLELPTFQLTRFNKDQKPIRMKILPNTQRIRPIVVGAILRNIKFTAESYNSFIKLQDKLHQNLCRNRTLVAIGTHDLDTLKPPFIYDAREPKQIKFRSLNQQKEMQADEMMEFYLKDTHLKRYVSIIKDSDVYPVIYDSNNVVLSLPPIINGDHSKMNVNTKNIFIECTAVDQHKANIVLNIMLTMFAQYCSKPFEIEPVEVEQVDGKVITYPDLNDRSENVSVKKINQRIGINVDAQTAATLLNRMSLRAKVLDSDTLRVDIPVTRADILHFCDIAEDCAVAYGFNNILKTVPKTSCIGNQFELNRVSDLIRHSVAEAGFIEALTFTLCSISDVAEKFGKDIKNIPAVHIANPKTQDFQIGRTSLLPGLLKTIANNQGTALPIQLFEVSDVVLKDSTKETGTRNERRLCAVYYNRTPGFETIHGLLDRIMTLVKIPYNEKKTNDLGYYLNNQCEDSAFFPGRHAQIIVAGQNLGVIGVLHPNVIEQFGLKLPCSILELNIEPFV
jgi:phenylalanyl-tRNA synthetase beta chain